MTERATKIFQERDIKDSKKTQICNRGRDPPVSHDFAEVNISSPRSRITELGEKLGP